MTPGLILFSKNQSSARSQLTAKKKKRKSYLIHLRAHQNLVAGLSHRCARLDTPFSGTRPDRKSIFFFEVLSHLTPLLAQGLAQAFSIFLPEGWKLRISFIGMLDPRRPWARKPYSPISVTVAIPQYQDTKASVLRIDSESEIGIAQLDLHQIKYDPRLKIAWDIVHLCTVSWPKGDISEHEEDLWMGLGVLTMIFSPMLTTLTNGKLGCSIGSYVFSWSRILLQ